MNDHVEYFDGYLAELVMVFAEKAGVTPADYILSFFGGRCNAPSAQNEGET